MYLCLKHWSKYKTWNCIPSCRESVLGVKTEGQWLHLLLQVTIGKRTTNTLEAPPVLAYIEHWLVQSAKCRDTLVGSRYFVVIYSRCSVLFWFLFAFLRSNFIVIWFYISIAWHIPRKYICQFEEKVLWRNPNIYLIGTTVSVWLCVVCTDWVFDVRKYRLEK